VLGLTLLTLLTACPSPPASGSGDRPFRVVVSVPPQAYFVERIAGPRARITVLLPPGSSPEVASPSPRQMVALLHADLVVLVGHPSFVYERRHVLPVLKEHPEIPTVSMTAALDLPGLPEAEPHDHSHHGAADPHVWVSPHMVKDAVGAVGGTLIRLDPEGAPILRRRLEELRAEIEALDREIRHELAGHPESTFLTYHPAWGHFAEEYGLEQLAIETEGKEPSGRHLVELIEDARSKGVHTIFAQEGLPRRGAEAVADEIGARVVVLDPLDRDWPGTLRTLARAVGGHAVDRPAAPAEALDTSRADAP
jgi:zinc transport system substrate-binding protein